MEERALMRILGLAEHDPRLEANGITADRISFLGEEMVDWGLDPNEVSEEAFLKARDRFLRGRIELEDVTPWCAGSKRSTTSATSPSRSPSPNSATGPRCPDRPSRSGHGSRVDCRGRWTARRSHRCRRRLRATGFSCATWKRFSWVTERGWGQHWGQQA